MVEQKVAALYHLVRVPDCEGLKSSLIAFCKGYNILGGLIVADEGLNGTVAGNVEGIDSFIAFLRSNPLFCDIDVKFSFSGKEDSPFHRLRVRIKPELITMGVRDLNLDDDHRGVYLNSYEWNDMIKDPDVVVLDVRNTYETEIGSFQRALDPKTEKFGEFPTYVEECLMGKRDKKVAMFCTGGIRCEKASAYLKERCGFQDVYHLKGGILKYLEEIPVENSLFVGDCYVFDGRVSVQHGLKCGSFQACAACRHPLSPSDCKHEEYIEGIACGYCAPTLTPKQKIRAGERHLQMQLARKEGTTHLGNTCPQSKGRQQKKN
jgi:UPF0176 protein